MCGFYKKSVPCIPDDELLMQRILSIKKEYESSEVEEIDIFCAGNFLNEGEITVSSANEIFGTIRDWKSIKRIVIESRPRFITQDNGIRLKEIKDFIPDKDLIVGMGYECHDDNIMKNVINKGYGKQEVVDAIGIMKKFDVKPRVYVLLKPPFFNEQEAIDYCVETVKSAKSIGIEDVHIETMKVHEGTLIHSLYAAGLYTPPSIWSLIDVIKNLQGENYYVSPCEYNVPAIAWVRCCDACRDNNIWHKIQTSSITYDIDENLGLATCSCKDDWKKGKENSDGLSIKERGFEYLWKLEHGP